MNLNPSEITSLQHSSEWLDANMKLAAKEQEKKAKMIKPKIYPMQRKKCCDSPAWISMSENNIYQKCSKCGTQTLYA